MPGVIQRHELVHMLNKNSKVILLFDFFSVALQFNCSEVTRGINALLQNNAEASKAFSVASITLWDARKHAREQTIIVIEQLSIFSGASSKPLKCLESSRDVSSFTC